MGKKKSVTFELPPPTNVKVKKEKNIDSEIEARQKHINNLLETKKELENKIKMAANKKKKPLLTQTAPAPLLEEVVCCVPLCTNTSFVTKSKMFFPFPLAKKMSKQWVANVGRKGFNKQSADHLHQNYKVCSDHFEPTMFVPKTKNRILITSAIPTIFESIHEPEISITTGPPVKKRQRARKATKPPIIEDDFDYDEDLPLISLLPPKISMKKKLVKKSDASNKAGKWMYKPSVQIVKDTDNDAVQSSGSEEEYESCDLEDADPNDANFDPSAPKRRKMGTRRKPKETLPLTMECYSDELSPAQKEAYATATQIYEECKKKLDELAKMKNAKLVFNNEEISAYEIDEGITNEDIEIQEEYQSMGVAGLPVCTSITVLPPTSPTPAKRNSKQTPAQAKTKQAEVAATTPQPVAGSYKIKTLSAIKPQESTSIGGLFSKVSKSTDGGSTPDSKEVAFNKLAGKTYPSLVVIARPCLKQKESAAVFTNERAELDAKVKAVLLYSSSNLTEWLIQQGLLRSEQTCSAHFTSDCSPVKLKLGMYSDVTKFPHSGGYVWISECCPHKFVSVFYNSIFEGAPHTPSVLVKLMYHWACQTSIGNVTSWVKIDNLYLKTFYSYMRCVCTGAVHEKHELIGGPGKKVEVGVISLGTTNVDGNLRQVKVEVLGVLETDTNKIRLRAIEPLPESERNQKKRFAKIMEPLREWVSPDSAVCTDFTVDKSAFLSLGFKNVHQVSLNDANPPEMNNKNIMEYLRRVVPRMFQNTLSLLSRHIIQQFLDELVWRERFGPTPARAFESIVQHLAEQTRLETGGTLLNRYQKISVNPFANWKYSHWTASCVQPVQEPKALPSSEVKTIQLDSALAAASESEEPEPPPAAPVVVEEKRGRKRALDRSPLRPSKKLAAGAYVEEGDTSLEAFYYGTLPGRPVLEPEFSIKYSCPTCSQIFSNNISLLSHLSLHSVMPSSCDAAESSAALCRYCLGHFSSPAALNNHVDEVHVKKYTRTKCLICEERCREKQTLVKHMERSHHEAELPYSCDYCSFRSSEHGRVVDHFHESHATAPVLQCPLCLKVVVIGTQGDAVEKNISFFLVHLQRHQKRTARKCPRCVLTFPNKMLIREHQLRDHASYRGVASLCPHPDTGLVHIKPPAEPKTIGVPRLKMSLVSTTYRLVRFVPRVKMTRKARELPCHECEVPLGVEDHMPGVFTCTSCPYTTCCVNAMTEHAKCFHALASREPDYYISPPTILGTRMYCVCGFNSHSGNKLARHTALCKKISVYPTQESADAARVVVKPTGSSILNNLGLIRKDDKVEEGRDETKVDEEELDTPPGDVTLEEDALNTDKPEEEKDNLQTTAEDLERDNENGAKTIEGNESNRETLSEAGIEPALTESLAEGSDVQTGTQSEKADADADAEANAKPDAPTEGVTMPEQTSDVVAESVAELEPPRKETAELDPSVESVQADVDARVEADVEARVEAERDEEALADAEILAEANLLAGESETPDPGADLDSEIAGINNNENSNISFDQQDENMSTGGDNMSLGGDESNMGGEGSNIGDGSNIGEGSNIGDGSNIGEGSNIGDGSNIGEGSNIGDGSNIGEESNPGVDALSTAGEELSNVGDALSNAGEELSNTGEELSTVGDDGENSNVGDESNDALASEAGEGNAARLAAGDNAVDVGYAATLAGVDDAAADVTEDSAGGVGQLAEDNSVAAVEDEEPGGAKVAEDSSAVVAASDDEATPAEQPEAAKSLEAAPPVEGESEALPVPGGSKVGVASLEAPPPEDDDAELIKQDMAALQQDLAALSGTCDIPLNTILDRQMESSRGVVTAENMDTASPQAEERMESQDVPDSGMEVEDNGAAATPPTTMECDSPGDNILVE